MLLDGAKAGDRLRTAEVLKWRVHGRLAMEVPCQKGLFSNSSCGRSVRNALVPSARDGRGRARPWHLDLDWQFDAHDVAIWTFA